MSLHAWKSSPFAVARGGRIALLCLLLSSLGATMADAQPTFSKVFDPDVITTGNVSTLVFTIENTDPTNPATGMAFTDTFPVGMTVADPANVLTDCTAGTLTAPFGGNSISLAGGEVAAATTCTVSVDVTTTVDGMQTNTSGDLTSSLGNSGSASAELFADGTTLGFSKVFGPDVIAPGGVSTLTFTLDNPAPDGLADISFDDPLPTDVFVAPAPNATTDCAAGAVVAAAGGTDITFSMPFLGGNTTCTVAVDVTSAVPGFYVNTSGDLLFEFGSNGRATAALTVVGPPPFAKQFDPSTIEAGESSTLTFLIDNTAAPLEATTLDFTDNLPAGVVVANPANAVTDCVGGTLTADPGTGVVTYTGGSVAAGAACMASVDVTAASAGVYVNLTEDLTSNLGNSGPAAATLNVLAASALEIPTLSGWGLGLTVLLLGLIGLWRIVLRRM